MPRSSHFPILSALRAAKLSVSHLEEQRTRLCSDSCRREGLRTPCRETMEAIVAAAGWMEGRTGGRCRGQGIAREGSSKLPQPGAGEGLGIMVLAFTQGFSSARYLRNITKCHLLHIRWGSGCCFWHVKKPSCSAPHSLECAPACNISTRCYHLSFLNNPSQKNSGAASTSHNRSKTQTQTS